MNSKLPVALTVVLATSSLVSAQPDWSIATGAGPGARFGHAMAYDWGRDVVVLFGGISAAGPQQNDTWEFDGTTWTQVFPATSPPGRDGHTMAYNLNSGRVFLFGGDGGPTNLDDTWEWDGTNWIQLNPTTIPQTRKSHMITYDLFRGRIAMFGGNDNGALGDTWYWDDAAQDWVQQFPTNAPSPRLASAMDIDPFTGDLVLYSGYQMPADTWLFDGTNWTQAFPANNPGARYDHTLTTDTFRGRVVLFGSLTGVSDTWEWDGTDWIQRTPATLPSARLDQDVVYDEVRQRCVLFGAGGDPNTWVYENTNPAMHEVVGAGCAGSNGVPTVFTGDLPWLDGTFDTTVFNLPTGPSTMLFGFFPLAIDLDIIGMTNCDLLVDPLITVPLVESGGQAPFSLPISTDPLLIGLPFYYQAFCLDATSPGGATTSNAGHGTVGSR